MALQDLSVQKFDQLRQEQVKALEKEAKKHKLQVDVRHRGEQIIGVGNAEVDKLLEQIGKYLESPVIVDEFGKKHLARRDFIDRLHISSPDAASFYESNRLRFNTIYELYWLTLIFKKIFDSDSVLQSLSERLVEVLPQVSTEYDSLNDDEKVEIAEKAADILRQIVQQIHKMYSP